MGDRARQRFRGKPCHLADRFRLTLNLQIYDCDKGFLPFKNKPAARCGEIGAKQVYIAHMNLSAK